LVEMKKAITTLGFFGLICSAILLVGSVYLVAPPFGTSAGILLRGADLARLEGRAEIEPFSKTQIRRIEEALREGELLYQSEKKLLKSKARHARYCLFFMSIACLAIGLTPNRQNTGKLVEAEKNNEV
jgi:hypothetical protein